MPSLSGWIIPRAVRVPSLIKKLTDQILSTYLEDGETAGPTITITDIPFPYYMVMVYYSTANHYKVDAESGNEDPSLGAMQFSPLTINGVRYSWDASDHTQSTLGTPIVGAHPSQVFGDAATMSPTTGKNVIGIPVTAGDTAYGLSGDLTIQGGPRTVLTQNGKKVIAGRGGIAAIQILEVAPPSISVNMVGNASGKPETAGPIQGVAGNSGLISVLNARWNDFSTASLSGLVDFTGTVTAATVETDITTGSYGSYQNSTQNGYADAITDRGAKYGVMAQGYREACASTELRLRGVPYPRYDLILYLGTDKSDKQWNPVKVTTAAGGVTYYSYPAGSTDQAATASKTDPGLWGDTKNGLAAADMGLGKDAMLIRNLSGDVDIDTGTWNSAADGRGGICGFQIVYAGELRKAGALNLNFVGGMEEDGGVVAVDNTLHGLHPVPGKSWMNLSGTSGESIAVDVAYETDLSGHPAVTFSSTQLSGQNTTPVTILRGCLDPAKVVVENVPYEMYDVIVYLTTHDNNAMSPVMVNGSYYTWQTRWEDDNPQTPPPTTEPTHAFGPIWGPAAITGGTIDSASAPVYGVSALRIKAQTAKTLTVSSQVSRRSSPSYRGCIAAIQIVERIKVPVNNTLSWANATAGFDPSSAFYLDFGPEGAISGDVTLPEQAIVDFEDRTSRLEQPFLGALTHSEGVEYKVPVGFKNQIRLATTLPGTNVVEAMAALTAGGVYSSMGMANGSNMGGGVRLLHGHVER